MIRPERGEIHYIGGADILPAPLSLKEETEALNKFGTEEEKEAKSELIEHNLRLVVYIAKKFDNTSVGVEDLISIGTIGLIKAINTFNPTKNIKLATYASRCIENEILMYLRRTSKMKPEESGSWTCSCGQVNTGNFCSNCGKKRPDAVWTCSCGQENKGNFCANCGKPRP